MILKPKQELKRVLRRTTQIYKPHQGGEASLKFVMIHGAEEVKLGDGNKLSFRILIRYQKGGI